MEEQDHRDVARIGVVGQIEIELLVRVRAKGDVAHGAAAPGGRAGTRQRLDAIGDRGRGVARVGLGPGRLRFEIVECHGGSIPSSRMRGHRDPVTTNCGARTR